ncbi:MAG: AI-2E family transporter [Pseudomonadales bacterium]
MIDDHADLAQFSRRVLIVLGLVTLVALLIYFLGLLIDVLLMAFSGVLVAVAIDGFTRIIQRHTPLSRGLSLTAAAALIVVGFVGMGVLIGPEIGQQIPELMRQLPRAIREVVQFAQGLPGFEALVGMVEDQEALPDLGMLAAIGGGIFATIFGTITALIVIPLLGIYLVLNPTAYIEQLLMLLPGSKRKRTAQVFTQLGKVLRLWMLSRLISMIFVGVTTSVGLALLGVPLPLALGLLAGLLTFIPYLGPVIATIPTVLVALLESSTLALYAVVLYAAVEQVESSVVQPLAQKGVVHLPPAYTVVIQLAGGMIAGMVGVILATPLAVAAGVLVQMLYIEDVLGDEVEVMGK